MVVQTSSTGLHVWARLKHMRSNPHEWYRQMEVRLWYAAVGARLLDVVKAFVAAKIGEDIDHFWTGKVDMNLCGGKRFGRMPGWRFSECGPTFRCRLIDVQ